MNPRLEALHAYPFERLARLKAGITAPSQLEPIAMSIGEPQHTPPAFLLEALRRHLDRLGSYPATAGLPELRAACAGWLTRRYGLSAGSVDADTMVLPVNGTREALFAFVQAAVDGARAPLVAMPNPFYQIYEGAALLAGARPFLLDTTDANDYLPDLAAVPAAVWRRCQVLFLCSPGNLTGAVLPLSLLQRALSLADRDGFLIAAVERDAAMYLAEGAPPAGLRPATEPGGHAPSICGRTWAGRTSASRASCSRARASPCCPAATSAARAWPAIRAPGACASRSCRRWRGAWRRRSACANFCRHSGWRQARERPHERSHQPQVHHRCRVRAPRRLEREECAAGAGGGAGGVPGAARQRPGAGCRAARRRLGGQRMAEEGGAAVLPRPR